MLAFNHIGSLGRLGNQMFEYAALFQNTFLDHDCSDPEIITWLLEHIPDGGATKTELVNHHNYFREFLRNTHRIRGPRPCKCM